MQRICVARLIKARCPYFCIERLMIGMKANVKAKAPRG